MLRVTTEIAKRIATAVVLSSVIIAAIFLLNSMLFAVAIGLIASVAVWEWCRLDCETKAFDWSVILILFVGGGVPTLLVFPAALPWFLGIALLWWVTIAVFITRSRKQLQKSGWQVKKWHTLVVIFPAAAAITGLHEMNLAGRWYVVACLLIVWTTDTSAYMVGRVYGKSLLAPGISPAKTVEGAWGGLIGATIVGLVLYEVLPVVMSVPRLYWVVLVVLTSGFSIVGDLAESAYKRTAGVKDSGWILPGHGGALDRIDSTLASAPVFAAGILFAAR